MSHPTPAAPDSPALGVTVSGTAQKYAAKKKKVLNAEEGDLHDLTQAAGIVVDPEVFKIIVDLLKMNVAPLAVFQTLKAMCAGQRISDTTDTSAASHSTAAAPSEPREESTVVSGKGSKPAAPAPRPAKGGAKIVVYPPGDASSLSQVRSKTSQGHGEKSGTGRDASSHRVPRQPSATRGQKSAKSSGSSSSSSQLASN
ncbi:mitotic-spindle organizing protein 2 isoform X2 [Denticeps clupeoides]|uniref:Mitotic-spindle organizing protein 2 n=1 Tax=Denticeps clupeoides TaxID=299321 RepID=A0AAY4EQF6_9TELE|nr:mitotic-spindle organizing protein 2-like isoform X2 [Denticeps clupeoides]